jgi:hypothetical protein
MEMVLISITFPFLSGYLKSLLLQPPESSGEATIKAFLYFGLPAQIFRIYPGDEELKKCEYANGLN